MLTAPDLKETKDAMEAGITTLGRMLRLMEVLPLILLTHMSPKIKLAKEEVDLENLQDTKRFQLLLMLSKLKSLSLLLQLLLTPMAGAITDLVFTLLAVQVSITQLSLLDTPLTTISSETHGELAGASKDT